MLKCGNTFHLTLYRGRWCVEDSKRESFACEMLLPEGGGGRRKRERERERESLCATQTV